MTIRQQIQKKSRVLRLGFFASWALMAVPMFFKLDPPYSYAVVLGAVLALAVLLVAYRSIRCPRCGGSLWLAGMGFVAPGTASGPGQSCPKCGVDLGESAGL
jgi:hypothetical protein